MPFPSLFLAIPMGCGAIPESGIAPAIDCDASGEAAHVSTGTLVVVRQLKTLLNFKSLNEILTSLCSLSPSLIFSLFYFRLYAFKRFRLPKRLLSWKG
jgi:hypothetical protein